jgi:uncharacterized protein YcbX
MSILVKSLFSYPIKSFGGQSHELVEIRSTGLLYDRFFALTDQDGNVITAREKPMILTIRAAIQGDFLHIYQNEIVKASHHLEEATSKAKSVQLFGDYYAGLQLESDVNSWLSHFLEIECYLTILDSLHARPVKTKYGGTGKETIFLADAAPILLLSEASLDHLNEQLATAITMAHFRPNIVVSGIAAHEEDDWREIKIGDVVFSIGATCKRCNIITTDPATGIRHPLGEPTRTLSTYRRTESGAIAFGAYLIPKTTGEIKLHDQLVVIN